jgi:hypothetical protein
MLAVGALGVFVTSRPPRHFGLTIPLSLLARADEVIE